MRDALRLQGVSELPPPEKIEKTIAKQHDFNRRNFTQVERHALMVRVTALRFAKHAAEHQQCPLVQLPCFEVAASVQWTMLTV